MKTNLTLGSLFDGIGGFILAAEKNGINTIWTSEIEPFPIAVSRQHYPKTEFFGDIKKLHGYELQNVDIVTAGSPCQDLSIAGKRLGLSGNRSSLFMEMIRIIKELRESDKTKSIRPRILLWENVPGVFSSNKGEDFRTILEQICKIKYETIFIPMPPKGKWQKSGYIVGDDFSVAWRVLNSQYFGVAQRRKRVFLVADLGGQSAPKILFESCRLSRSTSESKKQEKRTSSGIKTSTGETSKNFNITTKCYDIGMSTVRNPMESDELSPCITASCGTGENNVPAVLPFDTSFCTHSDSHSNPQYGNPCHSLSATSHVPKIAIDFGSNIYCLANGQSNSEILKNLSPTITSAAGTSGNNQAWITMSQTSYSSYSQTETSVSLKNSGGTIGGGSENLSIKNNIIRKLTPLECERLQGFPDEWTVLIKKENMTDDDYDFWTRTYQNYRLFRNKPLDEKISEEKIIKWYNKLQCDGSRYKALGNSIAVPCADFILQRIKETINQ